MHLVTKNTVDFTCNSAHFGKEIQNQLGFLLEKDLYPKLEILLNSYNNENYIWKIDMLKIDIGKIDKKNWKELFVNKILQQIEEFLKVNQHLLNFKNAETKEPQFTKEKKVFDEVVSKRIYAKILFFQFLRTGNFEENSISNDLEEIIKKIKIDEVFTEELIACFLKDFNCILRFIFSAPDDFKESFFKFFPVKNRVKVQLEFIFSNYKYDEKILNFSNKIQDKTQQKIWIEFLELLVLLSREIHSSSVLIKKFLEQSKNYWNISEAEIQSVFKYFEKEKNYFDADHFKFFKAVLENSEINKIFDEKEKIQDTEVFEKLELQKGIYIENAGLVILHPFLQQLFEKLELFDKEIWKSEIDAQKAVLLSQYLVTGKVEIQENELLLNKILCGFELYKAINTKLKITEFEKEQCEQLLKAVLEHWKPMSTSSIGALQETFLQRNAKLEETSENRFEIWVEEKGFDILFNQLPWGIGMVKTPWMDDYLTCNWNY